MKTLIRWTVLVGASFVPLRANIVLNPDFATGDFTSWDVTLAARGSNLSVTQGEPSAAFGGSDAGQFDTIAQTFNTVDGHSYSFQFDLSGMFQQPVSTRSIRSAAETVDPVGDFQAFWDGIMVVDVPAGSKTSLNQIDFAFTEVGTGKDTITFQGYNVGGDYFLQRISVEDTTAAPEPATWALFGAGLAAFAALRRITR